MAAYAVILFEDSSSTLWIRPLFLFVVVLSTFSGQIRLPQLQEMWIRPLLLIKLGFMAVTAAELLFFYL